MNQSLAYRTTVIAGILLQSLASQAQHASVTLASELHRLADIGSLPVFVAGTEAQVSTFDTTGGNNDGFNGTYSFVCRNPDSSLVMLDLDGPGEINRIATPTPTTDTLDFYLDGEPQPRLSINYMDLFSGHRYPFVAPVCGAGAGGYFCYFPILFQRHCTVVSRGKHLQFHQIQYRLFPAGTSVETYSYMAATQARAFLTELERAWGVPAGTRIGFPDPGEKSVTIPALTLKPGQRATLAQIGSGGRITGIQLYGGYRFPDSSVNLWLRVTWDGEKRPAIEAPVSDLFGYVEGKPSMAGLLLGANDSMAYSYLPMPFDRSATIELLYKGRGESLQIHSSVGYTPRRRQRTEEGKLYVHYQSDTLRGDDPYQVFLTTQGKGHYIGTILYANGFRGPGTMFFEGDDSLATDGTMRAHGTGSEDYFNGGWYALPGRWDSARSFPLSGCLYYSEAKHGSGGYRFYIGDKVPFGHEIWMGIEHGPDPQNRVLAHYRSLAFYYKE